MLAQASTDIIWQADCRKSGYYRHQRIKIINLSRDMRFPTMWYVGPAKR